MLLTLSTSGGILITWIIILRFIAINKLPKRVFVLLWNIALLRLLLPFYLPFHYDIGSQITRIVGSNINNFNISKQPTVFKKAKGVESINTLSSHLYTIELEEIVWFAGVIIFLCYFGIQYFKEYQKIRAALPIPKDIEEKLRSVTSMPNRVKIFISDRISTPITYGILFPKIILPKFLELDNTVELNYVLTHELIHIKRADNLCKIIMPIAASIHWFNPLVWIMCFFLDRDMELSCDEKVISLLGWKCRKEYAMVLVNLAEKQNHRSLFSNGFGSNAIKERIVAIMKLKKVSVVSILCAVILCGMAITAFARSDSEIYSSDRNSSAEKESSIKSSGTNATKNPVSSMPGSEQFSKNEDMGSSAIEDNTGTEDSDTLDNEMYATSDDNGDNSSTLKAYTAYGIVSEGKTSAA